MSAGTLSTNGRWWRAAPDAPPDVAGVLARTPRGRCVFHRNPGCAIQHAMGHDAMPSACRHFPRSCLLDDRGVFVTLSHYCPTVASLLFDARSPVEIVSGPPALPNGDTPEGFDARSALPPLLTLDRLMDIESYGAWERHTIALLTGDLQPEDALATLEDDAAAVSRWRPGLASLLERIDSLRDRRPDRLNVKQADAGGVRLFDVARESAAAPHRWPAAPNQLETEWQRHVESVWRSFAPVVGRYLASHAFASWMAYQGNGLLTLVSYLRLVLAVLRTETVRACIDGKRTLDAALLHAAVGRADLLLMHLVDRRMLAHHLNKIAVRELQRPKRSREEGSRERARLDQDRSRSVERPHGAGGEDR